MLRAKFIQEMASASKGILSKAMAGRFMAQELTGSVTPENLQTHNDHVLILIQLIGGNDGLNTCIPLDFYDNLTLHRSNILLPEKSLLKITDKLALHPSLAGFRELINKGSMSVIQNTGYPDQNRSHFRSMDIWNSASPSAEQWNSGWIGRYLDVFHQNYPISYPNKNYPDPLAISVGNIVSDTCQGKHTNFSYAIENIKPHEILRQQPQSTAYRPEFKELIDFLNSTICLTNSYSERIEETAAKGSNLKPYSEDNELAQQLKMIARLLSGGIKTKIFVLTLGGFDTHAYQTEKDNALNGDHARLLKTLGDAVISFQNDIEALGVAGRVLGITYSEFGRQVKSNSAYGTDHGSAAPMFAFGKRAGGKIIGETPVINKQLIEQEGVEMEFDFRDIYGSLLREWLGSDLSLVNGVFKRQMKQVNIVS